MQRDRRLMSIKLYFTGKIPMSQTIRKLGLRQRSVMMLLEGSRAEADGVSESGQNLSELGPSGL